MQTKQAKLKRRQKRVRAKIQGSQQRPRLSVFRSHQHIYAQLVDDQKGKTLLSFSDVKIDKKGLKKTAKADQVGQALAKEALEKKISQVVFDRGGYKYQGRVKALAEGARQAGLKF